MTDVRQTKEYATFMSLTGWKAEKINNIYCYIRKIPILGNFIKIQRPEKVNQEVIENLRKKYKPFQIIIEPIDKKSLSELGVKQSKSPYVPSKTLHLDLTKSKQELFNQLKKDTKYSLRKNDDQRTIMENDLRKFREIWKKSVPFDRYVISLDHLEIMKKSFGDKCLFLMDKKNSAGALFLSSGDIGYYWQAFTNNEGRKNLVQYKILWEGILWAKKNGCKIFDFEGIYDKRFPNKKWLGFTHFKKSFGGKEVEFPGAFSKIYWLK